MYMYRLVSNFGQSNNLVKFTPLGHCIPAGTLILQLITN